MKTLADLRDLLPELKELIKNANYNFGDDENPEYNEIELERDGWSIGIVVESTAEYSEGYGMGFLDSYQHTFSSFEPYHYDEDSEEETLYSQDELAPIIAELADYIEKL